MGFVQLGDRRITMNRKVWTIGVAGVAFVLSGGLARAQDGIAVGPPPGPAEVLSAPPTLMMMQGDPVGMEGPSTTVMGERIELLGFDAGHGGKVVTGSPFGATTISKSTQTLADGNRIVRESQGSLYRDSQGRFRREAALPGIGPLPSGHPKPFVSIHDPVAGTDIMLMPDIKVAHVIPSPPGNGKFAHNVFFSTGQPGFKGEYHAQPKTGDNVKTEDLGTQAIGDVVAKGTRYTRTIPAGAIGNENPIVVTSEDWYSSELQMVVSSKRNDPRFGESTYTLTNILRQEPDASLFTVPADYSVQQGPEHGAHFVHPGHE
jgi:hypothetical protein